MPKLEIWDQASKYWKLQVKLTQVGNYIYKSQTLCKRFSNPFLGHLTFVRYCIFIVPLTMHLCILFFASILWRSSFPDPCALILFLGFFLCLSPYDCNSSVVALLFMYCTILNLNVYAFMNLTIFSPRCFSNSHVSCSPKPVLVVSCVHTGRIYIYLSTFFTNNLHFLAPRSVCAFVQFVYVSQHP